MTILLNKLKSVIPDKRKIDKIINDCEIYRKDLIRYCLQYFEFEYEVAEDCVQEAYVALYESLCNGIEISNYKSWLYKVVLNYKNKTISDKIKRYEQDFKDSEEKENTINNSLVYEPDYVEQIVTDETIEKRMLIILSALNKNERYLYIAHYHKHKNFKEIAEEMGISHTAARQRHVELKRKIIDMIKEYEKS
ncbi:RNA polymerase sigma factor [Thomasclavelia cocleata]|uniref:RNA polymerase sigma factor n=1 Tax=Thomasclavelia cocleata TaxID=69824 RepID=UPI00255AE83F|nr:sigma-70 family RNA polymerase sigma factor [Thomasclavelia cocleata]